MEVQCLSPQFVLELFPIVCLSIWGTGEDILSKLKALVSQNSPWNIGNTKHCCYEPNIFSKRKRSISPFSSEHTIFLVCEEWREHRKLQHTEDPFSAGQALGCGCRNSHDTWANSFQQQPEEDTEAQSISIITQPWGSDITTWKVLQ